MYIHIYIYTYIHTYVYIYIIGGVVWEGSWIRTQSTYDSKNYWWCRSYACVYIHTFICMYMYIFIRVYMCMYIFVCIYIYIYIYIHPYAFVYIHTYKLFVRLCKYSYIHSKHNWWCRSYAYACIHTLSMMQKYFKAHPHPSALWELVPDWCKTFPCDHFGRVEMN